MSDDIIVRLRQQERAAGERLVELAGARADLLDRLRRVRKAIDVLEGAPRQGVITRDTTGSSGDTGMTDRVLRLLSTAERPLRVAEVAQSLGVEVRQVRNALGYLNRKGEVINVRRGVWTATSSAAGGETVRLRIDEAVGRRDEAAG